jgi:hypothetical protein
MPSDLGMGFDMKRIGAFVVVLALSLGVRAEVDVSDEGVRSSVERGLAFLLESQNQDGSWGGAWDSLTTWSGPVWSAPESHRSWRVATTGLCLAALVQDGEGERARAACEHAVDYIVANAAVKRPNEWDTMNNWAYIYGLEGMAAAMGHEWFVETERHADMAGAVGKMLSLLGNFQSLHGGWGYLELDPPRTRRPQWGTSFTTASAVVALDAIRDQGIEIDQGVFDRAVRIIKRCRLPNGGYTYHIRAIPNLASEYIDQVKGALSRIEVCQAALMAAGEEISLADVRDGLDHFFKDHKFLEIAMHKPVPHEAYYYNSGYFYLYGHYYAAMVIESLPVSERLAYRLKLRREVMKVQQKDGSFWDYDMHGYDRPYGTAFSVMALGRTLGGDE